MFSIFDRNLNCTHAYLCHRVGAFISGVHIYGRSCSWAKNKISCTTCLTFLASKQLQLFKYTVSVSKIELISSKYDYRHYRSMEMRPFPERALSGELPEYTADCNKV